MSIPSININPSSGSYNFKISLAIVDLPEPILPINATFSPSLIVKLTFFKAYASLSGYLKETFLNSFHQAY